MTAPREQPRVDVVVVSYRSQATLRACVAPLAALPKTSVVVVDNAGDDLASTLDGLPVEIVRAPRNGGFAYGCNLGAARGDAPHVLLLNPDARIGAADLAALVRALERDPGHALVAPRIVDGTGALAYSQRSFPRLRSTWAQALFLHRLAPRARWSDELVRDPAAYGRPGTPEWVSGACMLVRRDALARVGGLDEGYFLYCEDIDLCLRLRRAGFTVGYEPAACAVHAEGASAPSGRLLPVYARSRIRFARLHTGSAAAALERLGVATGAATHVVASLGRPALARGHAAALRAALTPRAA